MSSTYYFCKLFTNVKHIRMFVLWNSSKKNYNKYEIKSNKCQIKNKRPYRIGLRGDSSIVESSDKSLVEHSLVKNYCILKGNFSYSVEKYKDLHAMVNKHRRFKDSWKTGKGRRQRRSHSTSKKCNFLTMRESPTWQKA